MLKTIGSTGPAANFKKIKSELGSINVIGDSMNDSNKAIS